MSQISEPATYLPNVRRLSPQSATLPASNWVNEVLMLSNRNQRICLVLAALIGLGMVLFPPWRSYEQIDAFATHSIQSSESAGFHFLFSPPPAKPARTYVKTWVAVHTERLLLYLLALIGALAGLLLVFRNPTELDDE